MENPLLRVLVLFTAGLLGAAETLSQDAVDVVNTEYAIIESEGLEKMAKRQVTALEKIKDSALTDRNLDLANKANEKIEELKLKVSSLQASRPKRLPKPAAFPANDYYKMVSCNNKLGTEYGKEIVCKFERLPLNEFSGDKLILTISSNTTLYAETPNQVFIRNGVGGPKIGSVNSMRRGATLDIPLSISPSELLEIVVVVTGSNALHLKPFSEYVPEMYLTIQK